MNKRVELFLFILLLIGVVATQLFLSSQTPNPSFDSYFEMRQIESIAQTGFPLSSDDLSYQGRTHAGGGLFHYLCFALSLILPLQILFKFGGIIFLVLIVIFSYLITRYLFPTKGVALLTTTVVASSTVFLTTFANTLSSELVFAVFFLAATYTFLRFEHQNEKPWWFIGLVITSSFVSSLSLLFVVIFLFYFALLRLEKFSIKKKEFEAFLVSGLFVLWFHLLMYKKVLFLKGAQLLSQS
ncbi:MAG: glycosyltransferase family 39 protein, partial [Candidatus Nanoarchaeia archaeon]